jgi:hypothetical protein
MSKTSKQSLSDYIYHSRPAKQAANTETIDEFTYWQLDAVSTVTDD